MKFIELTQNYATKGSSYKILVNYNKINYLASDEDGGTYIQFDNVANTYVKELQDEILNLIKLEETK